MTSFELLLTHVGTWVGKNVVDLATDEPAEPTPSRLTVSSILNDTFVRLDQAWDWKGQPQAGSFLIGYRPELGIASAHWIDTFHNGRGVMALTGRFEPERGLVLNGSFSVGSGPDWGWRIMLRQDGGQLHIDMTCIEPTGKEQGGVHARFTRAATT